MMVLNNVTKDLSSLKVKDLKALSREKGLKLEHKGHKFTKQELINNLVEFYKNEEKEGEEEKADVVEAIEAVAEVVEETQAQNDEEAWEEEKEETETKEQETENKYRGIYATTLKQIAEKYSYEKPQWVYDEVLQIGSTIAFIHYVEAKDQNVYRKLRFAKVVGINRKQKLVKVQTFYGTEVKIGFDELLFIVSKNDTANSFPKDIRNYIKGHRTKQGRRDIHDRYINSSKCEE
jgi:hypothetical protein|nr:MAG TPA: PROTEIN THO1 BINDING PROTEIN, SAP [Caudoviricetes sp.]